jgi:hypothetical protein
VKFVKGGAAMARANVWRAGAHHQSAAWRVRLEALARDTEVARAAGIGIRLISSEPISAHKRPADPRPHAGQQSRSPSLPIRKKVQWFQPVILVTCQPLRDLGVLSSRHQNHLGRFCHADHWRGWLTGCDFEHRKDGSACAASIP